MALIFIEGFDTYSGTSDLAMNGWAVPSSPYNAVPGRFGVPGRAMPAVGITKNLPNNYTTFYMGFAVNGGFTVMFFNVGNYQFYVKSNASSIQVYRNNAPNSDVLIGQSLTNVVPSSGWFFVEIGATIDATAGSVTVRINGNAVLSVTSADTQGIAGSANNIVSGIEFMGSSDIDDLYFCDGTTGPGSYPCNTFLGDKRVRTIFPSSNISTQFTPVASVAAGQGATGKGGNYYTLGANQLILSCDVANPLANLPETGSYGIDSPLSGIAPRMAQDATITSILLYAQTNYPAMKIRPVIASIDPAALTPSQILYVGDERIGLSAGQNTLTFNNVTASVYKDTDYALGFITDTSFAFDYFNDYSSLASSAQTYSIAYVSPPSTPGATLPPPASSVSSSIYPDIGFTYTVNNYAAVSEDGVDQDQTYNVSGTVGAIDLYGTNAGLPSGATVYGVQVCGVYRKDDAGSRSVANLIKSGATQTAGATKSIGTSYQYYSDLFATNPATGASWAVSDVNALEIGCEVVS